jgi:hypothetical protein
VEGLLASTSANPELAFRNHTLPPHSAMGHAWKEDLLWLEPETACTNFNITMEYTMPQLDSPFTGAKLTDRGGLFNLPPQLSHLGQQSHPNDPQLQ